MQSPDGNTRRNFLQYTSSVIRNNGYDYSDVAIVGSGQSAHRCTWLEFVALADFTVEMGDGWGAKVASDLTILMKDGGRFLLMDFDFGPEWMCVKPLADVGAEAVPITHLINHTAHIMGFTLEQLNSGVGIDDPQDLYDDFNIPDLD